MTDTDPSVILIPFNSAELVLFAAELDSFPIMLKWNYFSFALSFSTGATLKENGLTVLDTIVPIRARLIAGKASYSFLGDEIRTLTEKMKAQVKNDD